MDESMEESIRIEKIMLQKIQELKIENTELNTKLGLLDQDKATTTDEEEEEEEEEPVKTCQNCNNPTEFEDDLLCHSCYHESCNETGDECWCENADPVLSIKKPLDEEEEKEEKTKSNNLLDAFDEELNFETKE
jgi:predicted sulfurtransferase